MPQRAVAGGHDDNGRVATKVAGAAGGAMHTGGIEAFGEEHHCNMPVRPVTSITDEALSGALAQGWLVEV